MGVPAGPRKLLTAAPPCSAEPHTGAELHVSAHGRVCRFTIQVKSLHFLSNVQVYVSHQWPGRAT